MKEATKKIIGIGEKEDDGLHWMGRRPRGYEPLTGRRGGGLPHQTYAAKVVKIGNSLAVRIPFKVALLLGIGAGDEVSVTIKSTERLWSEIRIRKALDTLPEPARQQAEEAIFGASEPSDGREG